MSQNFITDFPGTRSDWNGYARYDFKLDGVDCILVKPNVPEAAGVRGIIGRAFSARFLLPTWLCWNAGGA